MCTPTALSTKCVPRASHAHRPPLMAVLPQITAEHEYACLCTFLETILTMMWCAGCLIKTAPPPVLRLLQVPILRCDAEPESQGAHGAHSLATLPSLTPAQDIIEVAFEKSVDGGRASPMLGSRLHDFGFRGCTCVEQASQR